MKKIFKLSLIIAMFTLGFSMSGQTYADEIFLDPGEQIESKIIGEEKENIIKEAEQFEDILNVNQSSNDIDVYLINGIESINKNKNYYKVIYDKKSFISFMGDNLIQSDTIEEDIEPLYSERAINEESNLDTLIKNIEDKGYRLTLEEKFDEEKMFYRLEKKLNEKDTNGNDFISIFYSPKNDNIIRYTTVNNDLINTEAKISKLEAEKIVEDVDNDFVITESKLSTYKDSEDDKLYLSYEVKLSNGDTFYVDAENGDILYQDVEKGTPYKGKAIVNTGFSHARESADLSKRGMTKLGYSTLASHYTSYDIATPIEKAVKIAGFRALYVDCHGDKNVTTLSAEGGRKLKAKDLAKKYPKLQLRFVFLDACSTGKYRTWANVFKINNRTGAFVGWDNTVSEKLAYDYLKRFWKYADGKTPIKRAVEKAYSEVKVDAKPVFYGNSTFYGTAK